MAKLAHKKILFNQGIKVWNNWRKNNPDIKPDLSGIELDLFGDFDFEGGNFKNTNLSRCHFHTTNFRNADFFNADIRESSFANVDFSLSNLKKSKLGSTNFFDCNFTNANLSYASLDNTIFTSSILSKANLSHSDIDHTFFIGTEISKIKGINKLNPGLIYLGIEAIQELHKIPTKIREATFVDDLMIEVSKLYKKGISISDIDDLLYEIHDMLLGGAVQINPLFISYSHKDKIFVDVLCEKFKKNNIRFFRDVNDAPSGRLERIVSRAIRLNPTVILVLSKNSINSDWVQHEARIARSLEIELKRDVLCPIALDDSWENSIWPERLQEQIKEYNILDFSKWKKSDEMNKKFSKLLEGLDLFYKVSK